MKTMSMLFMASVATAVAGERVITRSPKGHMIHHRQAFSPDGEYIYFDSRNDETRLAESAAIGRVNIRTGKEETLYRNTTTSKAGPGCGAVTCSPASGRLAFIHGLTNTSPEHPYGFSRRFGGTLSPDGSLLHLDARDITPPYTAGSLRGGTHAHHWSPDGSRISFTYNDALIPEGSDQLRSVGVMQARTPVKIDNATTGNEFSGSCFAVMVAKVTLTPKPGSDEMSRAFDEGWIDKKRLAFQGNVLTKDGRTLTEIFLATLPDDLTRLKMPVGPSNYPQPPSGIGIKRLTHTENDPDAGINGPRQWLRPCPDGKSIAFLDTDGNGIVQIHSVPATGGTASVLSHFKESVDGPFNWSPDGKQLVCSSGGRIWLMDGANGGIRALTGPSEPGQEPRCGVVFSPDGKNIAYNRMLPGKDGAGWLQVCVAGTGENP